LCAIVEPVSLYETVYSDGGDSIYVMDQIADDSSRDELWLEDIALKEAIAKLSEKERSIIKKRFYGGKTQMEIAEEIGISQAQVSRLEKGAFERIRKNM
ncbi:MAG: sigma-70 family RNA polymerase sigma factor, partial [Clostridia bacterium]|nr:sigma-70 family RNA polymerase sigma factor [Clostridia bacterium]